MNGRHPRYSRVERHEEVERLGTAHLADYQVFGAHAQRFPYQVAQGDFARPLGARGPGLHGDVIPVGQAELENLLAGDHAPGSREFTRERSQQRRLARLGASGHQNG